MLEQSSLLEESHFHIMFFLFLLQNVSFFPINVSSQSSREDPKAARGFNDVTHLGSISTTFNEELLHK